MMPAFTFWDFVVHFDLLSANVQVQPPPKAVG